MAFTGKQTVLHKATDAQMLSFHHVEYPKTTANNNCQLVSDGQSWSVIAIGSQGGCHKGSDCHVTRPPPPLSPKTWRGRGVLGAGVVGTLSSPLTLTPTLTLTQTRAEYWDQAGGERDIGYEC